MDYNFFGLCNLNPPVGDVDHHLCFTNQLLLSVRFCTYLSGMPTPVTGTFGANLFMGCIEWI